MDERNLASPTNYNDSTNCDSKTTVSNYNDDAVFVICAGGYRVEGVVNGVRVKFIVDCGDSGAAVTPMRIETCEGIRNSHPQNIRPPDQ